MVKISQIEMTMNPMRNNCISLINELALRKMFAGVCSYRRPTAALFLFDRQSRNNKVKIARPSTNIDPEYCQHFVPDQYARETDPNWQGVALHPTICLSSCILQTQSLLVMVIR